MNELDLLKEIEKNIRLNKDSILMEIVPADCKCQGKTKKVFRCTEAFEINLALEKLNKLRKGENHV